MNFHSDTLFDRLTALLPDSAATRRFVVAFSGGRDSTVLLHALAGCRSKLRQPVVALHVNHGLQEESAAWESTCRGFASALGVDFTSLAVTVVGDSGLGPEAAAREARYAAFVSWMRGGDCLLSAHHQDDQAETLLLNLMRGSGVAGLAGIGACQAIGAGLLLRPLLGVAERLLADYAELHGLEWIDDPSNADTRFDRNFLRQDIIPQLAARWPAVGARLRQSSDLASEAAALLRDLADIDLAAAGSPGRLDIGILGSLSESRQRNLLRQAVRLCGLPPPPATRLYQAVHELIPARPDAQPLVRWPGAELRRYRDTLYVLPEQSDLSLAGGVTLTAGAPAANLGPNQGQLRLEPGAKPGIDQDLANDGLLICYRSGGESIRPLNQGCTHKLRKLMQEAGVVPWMRHRIPLLYAGDALVAVGDLWIAEASAASHGYAVCWDDKPLLY